MLQRQRIIDLFLEIKTWQRKGERAPHKPLLLLVELGRCARGESRTVHYLDVEKQLGSLLTEFGPPRKTSPSYPFWRLQADKIWQVSDRAKLDLRAANTDPKISSLRKINPTGALDAEIWQTLRRSPALIRELAALLLDQHFPASIHEDILAEVGLDLDYRSNRQKKRDPAFRERVLRAYEHRCAVCGFDLRLGHVDLALEAAHIMWHQAGGPDIESNGLALCTLHHKMFDRGAFTITDEHRVVVSQDVFGSTGLQEHLMKHHTHRLRQPQSSDYISGAGYLAWHRKEVFRGQARQS